MDVLYLELIDITQEGIPGAFRHVESSGCSLFHLPTFTRSLRVQDLVLVVPIVSK